MSKNKSYYLILLLAIFLPIATQTSAQDAGKMTLKQAVDFSLKNHPSIITYTNGIKIAKQQSMEGIASYLPQISGTATLDDNLKRQTTVIAAGLLSPVDLKIQLGSQYATNAYGELDQTIYDQSLINSFKGNKPNLEIAEFKKQQNEDVLAYNTANAYYQVLIYKEQEKLLVENEKKLKEILDIQKLQYAKGVIKKVDLDRVQVSLSSIQSQEKLALTNIDLAMNQLKNAMGMPLEANLAIADSFDFSKTVFTEPAPGHYDVKNTWDYKIMANNIILNQVDLSRRRALSLPTLTGYGRYGAQALGDDFEKQYKNWYDYSVIGLRLSVPIFDGLRRYSQDKEAELNLYSARENLKISTSNMQLQMLNSNTQLLSSYTNLNSNKENLNLAKEVLSTTTLQYSKGVASSSDLLNSDYSLKEAQSNYINSLYSYLISSLNIQKNQGTIKQYINQL